MFGLYRPGRTAIITIPPRESRERFDLDDNVCSGLHITSKESVLTAEEAMEKLIGGQLDVLIDNTETYYTMPAINTDFEIFAARFDTQGCLEGPT